MVAGANSYRQMHEFIRIHLQRLNGSVRLVAALSYTGLRLSIQGRVFAASRGGAYQLRRRREATLERETDLRIFACDRLAERWTQISGWLKSGNEPRLRALMQITS
jgi:hypothetical protein